MPESLTFQNLFKNRKLLPAEKFGNILAFDKESKTKLLSLISAHSFIENNFYNDFRVEISFMAKWKTFWKWKWKNFKKTSFRYYGFSVAINVFL